MSFQQAALLQRLQDLFHEERIAIGLVIEELLQLDRERRRTQEGATDCVRIASRDPRECQLRAKGALRQRQHVPAAVGHTQQNPIGYQALSHHREKFARRLIHPVQILENDDERVRFGGSMEKPRNRLEDARSPKLRVELSEGRVACVDRQQRSKERHRGAIGLTKWGGRAVDSIANHLVGVAGLNGECALEQVDERVKWQ